MGSVLVRAARWPARHCVSTTALAAALSAGLTGCGGESNGAVGSAIVSNPPAAAPAAVTVSAGAAHAQVAALNTSTEENRIVRNDDARVLTEGHFDALDGYLQQSRRTLLGSGTAGSAATFSLPVSRPGYYEVFVWWPQGAPAGSAARTEVRHAAGSSAQTTDQTGGGGQWNSLGTFAFSASAPAAVVLSGVAGAPLLVDAVRLRYLGETRPDLSVRSGELPIGEAGVAYRARIELNGGVAPYSFRLASGTLPQGLTLDAASGEITGTPSHAGEYEIALRIGDAGDRSATVTLKLTVVMASPAKPEAPRALDFNQRESRADGSPRGTPPNLSALHAIVAAMPAGGWSKVNLNEFSSVWAPAELRPQLGWGNPTPDRILLAWSSVAWDPNRGQLILYGGGHANYRGNDVYLWKGSTQRWERGSLPSEMVQDSFGAVNPIDGAINAPSSAHTYDNSVFLPIHDRFLTFGGAVDPGGGHYVTSDPGATALRKTGPYLFDPSRANANKVGGTTGSHVKREGPHPEVVGGQMWQNRENWLNASQPQYPWHTFVNGCTAYAQEDGKDVVYVRFGVDSLFRYTIPSLTDTTQDTWEQVGVYWGGPGAKASCGMDPVGKTFLRTAVNSDPFVYWDLSTAGPGNRDVKMKPSDPGGEFTAYMASGTQDISNCGLDFDPKRRQYALWCGDGRVWMLKPPATPSPDGWVITQQPTPAGAVPNGDVGTGILGKWKYIDNLDVFLGVQDHVQGNIWIYKPVGWQDPGTGGGGAPPNVPPSVALTQPSAGASVAAGSVLTLAANASDGDGSVVRVEFYVGSLKVGEATGAPYQVSWTPAAAGSVSLKAVAIDNVGAQTTSAAVAVTVTAAPPPNVPPTVALTQPSAGASVVAGSVLVLAASASDSDGSVARVEFYAGTLKVGEATAAPYQVSWTPAGAGSVSLKAVAVDNAGAQSTSAAVTVTVTSGGGGGGASTTVVLQRGQGNYLKSSDTFLSSYHQGLAWGAAAFMRDYAWAYSVLTRFAIFASEGGPVPDGATIESATLSLYKASYYDMSYSLHRLLKDWREDSANWIAGMSGSDWSVSGANGAGSDYAAAADATAQTDFNPGWIAFDVTTSVQQMSGNASSNYGWKLRGSAGYLSGNKSFISSEEPDNVALRPKMEIRYR